MFGLLSWWWWWFWWWRWWGWSQSNCKKLFLMKLFVDLVMLFNIKGCLWWRWDPSVVLISVEWLPLGQSRHFFLPWSCYNRAIKHVLECCWQRGFLWDYPTIVTHECWWLLCVCQTLLGVCVWVCARMDWIRYRKILVQPYIRWKANHRALGQYPFGLVVNVRASYILQGEREDERERERENAHFPIRPTAQYDATTQKDTSTSCQPTGQQHNTANKKNDSIQKVLALNPISHRTILYDSIFFTKKATLHQPKSKHDSRWCSLSQHYRLLCSVNVRPLCHRNKTKQKRKKVSCIRFYEELIELSQKVYIYTRQNKL